MLPVLADEAGIPFARDWDTLRSPALLSFHSNCSQREQTQYAREGGYFGPSSLTQRSMTDSSLTAELRDSCS